MRAYSASPRNPFCIIQEVISITVENERLPPSDARDPADLEAAATVFDLYFKQFRETQLPKAEEIVEAQLKATRLAQLMLDRAEETAPHDYANEPDLRANRDFFLRVISGAYTALVKRPGFTNTLQPAFMSWVASYKQDLEEIKAGQGVIRDNMSTIAADQKTLARALQSTSAALESTLSAKNALVQENEQLKAQLADAVEATADPTSTHSTIDRHTAATEALAQGNTSLAEQLFEEEATWQLDELHKHTQSATEAAMQAAKALRRKGVLAFLHDTSKALDAYRRATKAWPEDIESWNQLGHLYHRSGELDRAAEAYERVRSLAPLNDFESTWRAVAYSNLGIVYHTRGEHDRAIQMYEKALAINEVLERREDMAAPYSNLGMVYYTRGEHDRAVEMFEKSLEISKVLGHRKGMAVGYNNLGLVYRMRGELDWAAELYEKAIAINEALEHREGMASGYNNLGLVYKMRGKLDLAVKMYKKSLAINEALRRCEGMANNYSNLGKVYQRRGELDRAIKLWETSASLFADLGSPHEVTVRGWIANNATADANGETVD